MYKRISCLFFINDVLMTGGFVRYTRQHTQGQSLMTIEVEGGH